MKEITAKVYRVKFTSQKDGKERETLELDFNGKTMRLFENKFNYRVIDYLNELLDGKI